ncbi:MAG TPA: AIR synthase-related protein, partial [Nitrolancea sp.]|nr:AIR synthase-related protein [Nitrolancea sp.]
AVRCGDRVLVLKSDPITFATDEIGWYAPNVNANDIACMGAIPRWMLATALLADGSTTPEMVERIFCSLRDACAALGVLLVGGHTEITTGLERTIIAGTMIGEASEADLVDPRRAQPGDAVILARGIAIEGTSLISREMADELMPELGEDFLKRSQRFLHEPGISVVPAARLLHRALGHDLHGMHDPTEGGLATGLREVAAAAGAGIRVERDQIPVYPETTAICTTLGLDPLGLIASGALLATVSPAAAERAVTLLNEAGIPAANIGTLLPDPREILMQTDGRETDLPEFAVDEIARLFAERG